MVDRGNGKICSICGSEINDETRLVGCVSNSNNSRDASSSWSGGCSHCAAITTLRQSHNLDEVYPPLVSAVPIPDVSVVTLDEPSSSFIPPQLASPTTTTPTATAATPASPTRPGAATQTSNSNTATPVATFYKNPSASLLARAPRHCAIGALLVIQSTTPRGKFIVAQHVQMGQILQSVTLDMSVADFVHPVTTIYVGSILGRLRIVVPPGVQVETQGLGILGKFQSFHTTMTRAAHDDAPLIVVQGLAILGRVSVSVNDQVPPLQVKVTE